jgi:hypothetical protein
VADPMVALYLPGIGHRKDGVRLLRVEGDVAVVEGYATPEERYRLSDGRRVDDANLPTAWDFWRLTADSIRAIRAEAPRG